MPVHEEPTNATQHYDTTQLQRRENEQDYRRDGRYDEVRAGDFPGDRRYDESDRARGNPQLDRYQPNEGPYAARDSGYGPQDYRTGANRDWEVQGRQDYPQRQDGRGNIGYRQDGQRLQERELDRQGTTRHSSFDQSSSSQRLGDTDQGRYNRVGDTRYGNDGAQPQYGSALAEGSYRGRGPKGYQRSAELVMDDAAQRLEWDADVDASEIGLAFEGGVLTLDGLVGSRDQKHRAEGCVESVFGVTDVVNNLRVNTQSGEASKGQRQALRAQ